MTLENQPENSKRLPNADISKDNPMREWLDSRTQNDCTIHRDAVNLNSAFSRLPFAPGLSTLNLTPRVSHGINPTPYAFLQTAEPAEVATSPIRIRRSQVSPALGRLAREVNWDFFQSNRMYLNMSDISPQRAERWWNSTYQVYHRTCKDAAEGFDLALKIYRTMNRPMNSDDHVLEIEQTVLNPMLRFLVGYKGVRGGQGRGKAALEALVHDGNFVPFIAEWCEENGLTYPGGTGKTGERKRKYIAKRRKRVLYGPR